MPPPTAPDALDGLVAGLRRPEAYPHAIDPLRVVRTHISVVFLAGPYVYKVKKPVRFPFADFGTLERRRHFCHEEVRLNRRLAPWVYHGVVPIVEGPGGPHVADVLLEDPADAVPADAGGEVVEWAVRMVRLPPERSLEALLEGNEFVDEEAPALLRRLADRLATFHAGAERNEEISRMGDHPSVLEEARENLAEVAELTEQAEHRTLNAFDAPTVSGPVLERLQEHTERALGELRPLMEDRARRRVPCDGHGDLRLGHVYHLPDGSDEGRIVILDCVEFEERFRCADPVADIAFLAMELEFYGHPDLAGAFTERYLRAADDAQGHRLLPYYIAYRDIVRGKVRTLEARDADIPRPKRETAAARAQRHFMRALGRLAPPEERPVLLLLGGLPGVGKSALARALADELGFTAYDSDSVRKDLARMKGALEPAAAFEGGIYSPEWTDRAYRTCLAGSVSRLFFGDRVVVEASFRSERYRREFLEDARDQGAPALLLLCEADREVVRHRLEDRARDDAGKGPSDADWAVYQEMEDRWEPLGPETAASTRRIRTDRPVEEVLEEVKGILREMGRLG